MQNDLNGHWKREETEQIFLKSSGCIRDGQRYVLIACLNWILVLQLEVILQWYWRTIVDWTRGITSFLDELSIMIMSPHRRSHFTSPESKVVEKSDRKFFLIFARFLLPPDLGNQHGTILHFATGKDKASTLQSVCCAYFVILRNAQISTFNWPSQPPDIHSKIPCFATLLCVPVWFSFVCFTICVWCCALSFGVMNDVDDGAAADD